MPKVKKRVFVSAKGDFNKIAIAIEAQGIPVAKVGQNHMGDRIIEFEDPTVNIRLIIKGTKDGDYKVKLTANDVTKIITGTLSTEGINHISKNYALSDFDLSLNS
ncbi:MAG: hypothetical protein J7621_17570 [Niastella sp.]|nr:hypothetical protein [Niastella sp.]